MYRTSDNRVDWNELSREWPELIYLRRVEKLPNFPWGNKYFRNLCCGQTARPELKAAVFHVGRFAAMQKKDLVDFMQGVGGDQ